MNKVRYALIGFGSIAEERIAKEGYGCDKRRFNGRVSPVLQVKKGCPRLLQPRIT